MKDVPKLITSILVCELTGILATPITISAISTWYKTLAKPFFSPPNWIFGPVWTLLYLLMGISMYLIWKKGLKNKMVRLAIKIFLVQLLFNFLWSLLFFGLRSPALAFIDIVFLWIFIVLAIKHFYPLSRLAAYLLIPYILWVSFASLLNLAILLLNPN